MIKMLEYIFLTLTNKFSHSHDFGHCKTLCLFSIFLILCVISKRFIYQTKYQLIISSGVH